MSTYACHCLTDVPDCGRRGEAKDLLAKGDPNDAIIKLSRALVIQPRQAHLYHERAWAHEQAGDFPAAIQNMKKAMALGCTCAGVGQLSEQLADLHLQFGENHYSRKHYEAALGEFSKAAEVQPDNRIHTLKQYVSKEC